MYKRGNSSSAGGLWKSYTAEMLRCQKKGKTRFQCVSCGFVSNADTNAAINIRRLGMAQLHGEERSGSRQTPGTVKLI